MKNAGNFKGQVWADLQSMQPIIYTCGYCGRDVSSEKGYKTHGISEVKGQSGGIFICPMCKGPTYNPPQEKRQIPGASCGQSVRHVPNELNMLYEESRDCVTNGNHTAAVLLFRKMLMHIAVQLKAPENRNFIEYVEYLSDQGYVPPNGKQWVDHIRKKGNEANHEIKLMDEQDAKDLLMFIEMLLKFIYEFPNLIPSKSTP